MISLVKIRSDLGHRVFELRCSCKPDKPLILNLEKETLIFCAATGIVRCPRCGNKVHKVDILLGEQELQIASEEARKNWQTTNPDTGERAE